MEINRRDFLKISGFSAGGLCLSGLFKPQTAHAGLAAIPLRKKIGQKTTVCPYCSVGCNAIVSVANGKIVNIEGDPDCPINEGSLCPKGASLRQLVYNNQRVTTVRHRAKGSSVWEELSWDDAIARVAAKIKETRDANWEEKDSSGNIANHTKAIGSIGSVFPNSEEAYLYAKMLRALGLVYIENGARICVSSGVSANEETVGRGPMSNHWIDFANSDCILVIGCNIAESFPIACKHVTRAKAKGAKLIHVDPRFTRTSAKADIYARYRASTDVAFVGGIIRYVMNDMEKNPAKYNMEYLWNYTDAASLVDSNFKGPADNLNGLFSGWNPASSSYDAASGGWVYTGAMDNGSRTAPPQNPYSVFQLMKKHFARYTDDKVVEITGVDKAIFQQICETYAATGAKDKSGCLIFSASACQRSNGTQTVRCYGILQLLLGNMGVAGGGLNGITGIANGLGCSLQGLLNHWGPGCGSVRMPKPDEQTLASYKGNQAQFASLLTAWYGQGSVKDDINTVYSYLPKSEGTYHYQALFASIDSGTTKGLICWASNPAVSAPNSTAARASLSKLDWMVIFDFWETETADCDTEVFLLPAATFLEKEGSVCNGGRWNQWRNKAIDPLGGAKSDLWIVDRLMRELKKVYAGQVDKNAAAINNLAWDYENPPGVVEVLKEMNGYDLVTGKLLSGPGSLKADGSTSCGNWLWCGSYTESGNMIARRINSDPSGIGLYSQWGWAWPVNRRIMYNLASVDLDGNPWDTSDIVLKWDSAASKWTGDVADGSASPISKGGGYPFIMKTDAPVGRGRLFGKGKIDGPFPEYYEPWETPVDNAMSAQRCNPVIKIFEKDANGSIMSPGDSTTYPIICTTHHCIEHFLGGAMSRRIHWLYELSPDVTIEISEELAAERKVGNGEMVVVKTARGLVRARAIVTKRIKPVKVNGITVHQISVPWNWGSKGLCKGDSGNILTPRIGDPNTCVPEFRAFLCEISKA